MTRNKAAWYAVRALYRAKRRVLRRSSERALLEERVLLVRSTPDAAVTAAKQEALRREHSYKNVDGQRIAWKLQQILEISEVLDEVIRPGTEIYSRFHLNALPSATIKRLGFRSGQTVIRVG